MESLGFPLGTGANSFFHFPDDLRANDFLKNFHPFIFQGVQKRGKLALRQENGAAEALEIETCQLGNAVSNRDRSVFRSGFFRR